MPEQAWENPDLAASPFGSDPTAASIGFVNGKPAGSSSPLTWAQAQQARLIIALGAGRPLEQPSIVSDRYVRSGPPGTLPVTITAPADGATVGTQTVTVTGTTTPGATVDIQSTATDTGGATTVVTVKADAARRVLGDRAGAVRHLGGDRCGHARQRDRIRPAHGDRRVHHRDHGARRDRPGRGRQRAGHVRLPDRRTTSSRARSTCSGSRYRRRRPTCCCGPRCATCHRRSARRSARSCSTSTCTHRTPRRPRPRRRSPSRNYSIAADSAWCRRIEVQGFADPVFVDAAGAVAGHGVVQASQASGFITIVVPTAALGTPGRGLGVHGRAARPGRVLLGPGPRLRARPRRTSCSGSARRARRSPICAVDPGTRAEGDGRADAGRRVPGRRARPDRAAGRDRRGAGALVPDHDAEAHLVGGAVAPDHVARRHPAAARAGRRLASWVQVTRSTSPASTGDRLGQRPRCAGRGSCTGSRRAACGRPAGPG